MVILSYLKIGSAVVLALVVGYFAWTYQGMRNEVRVLETQHTTDLENLKVAEKTINILKEFSDVNEAIDNAPNDDVAEFLRTGMWPKHPDSKGNGVPTSPEPTTPTKSNSRQER